MIEFKCLQERYGNPINGKMSGNYRTSHYGSQSWEKRTLPINGLQGIVLINGICIYREMHFPLISNFLIPNNGKRNLPTMVVGYALMESVISHGRDRAKPLMETARRVICMFMRKIASQSWY